MKLKKGIFLSILLIILIILTVSAASAVEWNNINDNDVIYLNNQTYEITSQIAISADNVTIYGGSSASDLRKSTLKSKGSSGIKAFSVFSSVMGIALST